MCRAYATCNQRILVNLACPSHLRPPPPIILCAPLMSGPHLKTKGESTASLFIEAGWIMIARPRVSSCAAACIEHAASSHLRARRMPLQTLCCKLSQLHGAVKLSFTQWYMVDRLQMAGNAARNNNIIMIMPESTKSRPRSQRVRFTFSP